MAAKGFGAFYAMARYETATGIAGLLEFSASGG